MEQLAYTGVYDVTGYCAGGIWRFNLSLGVMLLVMEAVYVGLLTFTATLYKMV